MKVFVSGASGFIGKELAKKLQQEGNEVIPITRQELSSPPFLLWDPVTGEGEWGKMEGADAVIHLAGDNIASGRWTESKKKSIYESRIQGTRAVVAGMAGLGSPPKVFLAASAIGYYGDTKDQTVTEESPLGEGFLADVCHDWEREAKVAEKLGTRVAMLRFGFVLSSKGGGLAKMLPPFRLGLGGRMGSGEQGISWVTLPDLVNMILFVLNNPAINGPVNCVSPKPMTQARFVQILGEVLHRPTFATMPRFAVRWIFGEMGEAMLLSSSWVLPKRLEEEKYPFIHSDLKKSLQEILQ